jgi:hypothetical protein
MAEETNPNAFTVKVSDGKYELCYHGDGLMTCLRHGEPWPARDKSLIGDNLVFSLAFELNEDRIELAKKNVKIGKIQVEHAASLKRIQNDNAALRHALEPFGSLVIPEAAHVDMPVTTLRNAKDHPATIDDVDTAAVLLQSESPGQWLLDQWTSLQGFLRKQKEERENDATLLRESHARYIERDETVQDLANLIGWNHLERCPAKLANGKLCDRYKRKGYSCPWHDEQGYATSRTVESTMGREIEELTAKLANPTVVLWVPREPGIYWCNLTNGTPSGWHPVEIRNMGGLNDRLIVLIPGDEIHHDLDTFAHRVVSWGARIRPPNGG